MNIVLHLGVHKSATTYLQAILGANLDALHSAGVDFVPLDEMRSSITKRVPRLGLKLGSAVRSLLDRHSGYRRLILSDENLPGGSREIIDRTYYPAARKRVGRLLKALGCHNVEIMLSVRSYDDFVSSMYCECIRHGAFLTPAEYLRSLDTHRLNWSKLVRELCSLVGQDQVTLWRFEDFDQVETQILSAMTGEMEIDWATPSAAVRRSLSQKAVDELCALVPHLSREEIAERVEAISGAMPKGRTNPGFRAFDEASAAALRSRYDRDIIAIRSEFPRVRWIEPAAVGAALLSH